MSSDASGCFTHRKNGGLHRKNLGLMGFHGGLIWCFMVFHGDYRGSINQKTGMLVDIPSGKQPRNELEDPAFLMGA